MNTTLSALFIVGVLITSYGAEPEPKLSAAPAEDRVGFPKDYRATFQVLRVVDKPDEGKVVTVYGNKQASSVTTTNQLPYPYNSVLVMETAKAQRDPEGHARPGPVLGLHVMRRGKGFGETYGKDRAGEWEFVQYDPDGSFITPPPKSGSCAQCHAKAGPGRDFVYRARFTWEEKK